VVKPVKLPSAQDLADSVTPEEVAESIALSDQGDGDEQLQAVPDSVTVETLVERDVIYPDFVAVRCKYPSYEGATDYDAPPITYDQAMALLGWTVEQKGDGWGGSYLLIDRDKNKVRCLNNTDNRKLSLAWAETLAQDILRLNFKLNGESIIIGRTGRVISGQHRLIGFILAWQDWFKNPDAYPEWTAVGGPVLECLLVYGASEAEDVVRTIDNVKPRTVTDMFMTSQMFKVDSRGNAISTADREKMAGMTAAAVMMLWERTRAKENAWNLKMYRSNSESMEFFLRHRRLEEAIGHIFIENAGKKTLAKFFKPLGAAAGMMYLMAACRSDLKAYKADAELREANLNFDAWDDAQDFWVLLAAGDPEFAPVVDAFNSIPGYHDFGTGGVDEYISVLAKAWLLYLQGQKFKKDDPRLVCQYREDPNNESNKILDEWPTVGGVDLGPEGTGTTVTDADDDESTMSPDQIAEKIKREEMEAQGLVYDERDASAPPEPPKKTGPKPAATISPPPLVPPAVKATVAASKPVGKAPVKATFEMSDEDKKILEQRKVSTPAGPSKEQPKTVKPKPTPGAKPPAAKPTEVKPNGKKPAAKPKVAKKK